MSKQRSKSRGLAGKSLTEMIEAGKKSMPAKWTKYQRKHLKSGKKGRRPYPWRKKKMSS